MFKRTYAAPIHSLADCVSLHPEAKKQYQAYQSKVSSLGMTMHSMETLVQFYMDGKRSVSEIAHLVKCDVMMECHETAVQFIELLEVLGLAVQM